MRLGIRPIDGLGLRVRVRIRRKDRDPLFAFGIGANQFGPAHILVLRRIVHGQQGRRHGPQHPVLPVRKILQYRDVHPRGGGVGRPGLHRDDRRGLHLQTEHDRNLPVLEIHRRIVIGVVFGPGNGRKRDVLHGRSLQRILLRHRTGSLHGYDERIAVVAQHGRRIRVVLAAKPDIIVARNRIRKGRRGKHAFENPVHRIVGRGFEEVNRPHELPRTFRKGIGEPAGRAAGRNRRRRDPPARCVEHRRVGRHAARGPGIADEEGGRRERHAAPVERRIVDLQVETRQRTQQGDGSELHVGLLRIPVDLEGPGLRPHGNRAQLLALRVLRGPPVLADGYDPLEQRPARHAYIGRRGQQLPRLLVQIGQQHQIQPLLARSDRTFQQDAVFAGAFHLGFRRVAIPVVIGSENQRGQFRHLALLPRGHGPRKRLVARNGDSEHQFHGSGTSGAGVIDPVGRTPCRAERKHARRQKDSQQLIQSFHGVISILR